MSKIRVVPVPVLADNYAYLVIAADGTAAVVDPSEAAPVLEAASKEGATLTEIWNTHHHWDHVGGNRDLLTKKPDLRVVGYGPDAARFPGLTDGLDDGDEFPFGGATVRVIHIPAHTRGHVAYYLPDEGFVFTGDTLFAGGCGRLFEGEPERMLASLRLLADLPGSTRVYFGHEYTQKNLEFAATLEPGNPKLTEKLEKVRRKRSADEQTTPTTIAEELETNPFLRPDSPELVAAIREKFPDVGADEVAVFARTRELKDAF